MMTEGGATLRVMTSLITWATVQNEIGAIERAQAGRAAQMTKICRIEFQPLEKMTFVA